MSSEWCCFHAYIIHTHVSRQPKTLLAWNTSDINPKLRSIHVQSAHLSDEINKMWANVKPKKKKCVVKSNTEFQFILANGKTVILLVRWNALIPLSCLLQHSNHFLFFFPIFYILIGLALILVCKGLSIFAYATFNRQAAVRF